MFDFKFDWCKDLEIGNKDIDLQHMELLRIGRTIEQLLIQNCNNVPKSILLDIVCRLREYVSYHFYYEEELMQNHQYPNYLEHKNMHDAFKTKVLSIDNKALEKDPNAILSQLKIALQDWLFQHMLIHDRQMCIYINEQIG